MFKNGSRSQRSLSETLWIALPFIIYLYPAVALLTAKSSTPVFFNMYSSNLLLLNTITVAVYASFLFGVVASQYAIQFFAVFSLAVLTLVATNNSVLNLAGFNVTTHLARMFAGFALIVLAFLTDKHERSRLVDISLGVGAIVAFSATLDFGFASISRLLHTDKSAEVYREFRTAYDLTKATDKDIVLVGDSFVWGAGVSVDQRFGDILERHLNHDGNGSRVFSLGIRGADVKAYIKQLQDLPATSTVEQVVLCFYANDMPPRVNVQDTLQQIATSIGRRSVTLRIIVYFFRALVTPSVDAYVRLLFTHYGEGDVTFDFRWKQLEQEFREFFQLAAARSNNRPMMLILPMLVDFDSATFDEPMSRVRDLATRVGFRVVDAMPAFRVEGKKAEHYRAAPNDLHLNDRGNRIVAEVLFRAIANTP